MKRQKGFTLVEVLVAMAILSIGVVAVLQLFPHALRLVRGAAERTQAAELADSEFARLRAAGVGSGLSEWLNNVKNAYSLYEIQRITEIYAPNILYEGVNATIERIASAGDMYRVTFSVLMADGRNETFVTYVTKQ